MIGVYIDMIDADVAEITPVVVIMIPADVVCGFHANITDIVFVPVKTVVIHQTIADVT